MTNWRKCHGGEKPETKGDWERGSNLHAKKVTFEVRWSPWKNRGTSVSGRGNSRCVSGPEGKPVWLAWANEGKVEGDGAGETGEVMEPWWVPHMDFLLGGMEAVDEQVNTRCVATRGYAEGKAALYSSLSSRDMWPNLQVTGRLLKQLLGLCLKMNKSKWERPWHSAFSVQLGPRCKLGRKLPEERGRGTLCWTTSMPYVLDNETGRPQGTQVNGVQRQSQE